MSDVTHGASHGLIEQLSPPVSVADHVRGAASAAVTLVEFGDYECPNCGTAERFVHRLLDRNPRELAFVFRHLPVVELHPHAFSAALAAESAAAQGRFWEMHDLLFTHQLTLEESDLMGYAAVVGVELRRFRDDLESRRYESRVRDCLSSAARSGADRTPSFFLNGRRHFSLGLESLEEAVAGAIAASS